MPMFHNPTENTICTDIDGERYQVPPGAEIEIPRKYVYVVKSRGLPLVKGESPDEGAEEVESFEAPPPREKPLPPGVEAGAQPHDPDADDEDEDMRDVPEAGRDADGSDDDGESPVARAAAKLKADGVTLPGQAPKPAKNGRRSGEAAQPKAPRAPKPAPAAAKLKAEDE